MHTTIEVPNGCRLIAMLAKKPNLQNCKEHTFSLTKTTKQAMIHWIALLPMALKHPTPCEDLVPASANYGGYCDTSKQGAGGVWFGVESKLPAFV